VINCQTDSGQPPPGMERLRGGTHQDAQGGARAAALQARKCRRAAARLDMGPGGGVKGVIE
jgi:hypothetical protein